MKFYNCKNEEISKDAFLELYSNIYYYVNSQENEDKIMRILREGVNDFNDIDEILKWKMGSYYKKEIDSVAVFNVVKKYNNKELYDKAVDIKGLGPVYSATLLFFKSRMQYPIFDKFARIALTAIMNEDDLYVRQNYEYVSNSNRFWTKYEDYQKELEIVFGTRWIDDRKVDQALWAYGHMFKRDES